MKTSALTATVLMAGFLLGTGMASAARAATAPGALESPERISATARDYIAARHPWRDMSTEVVADQLDPRSRLTKCSSALQAFLPPGARIKRRTTVGVRCSGSSPWKIYVPVTVAAYAKVMVTRHPIAPGMAITQADISWSKRDISALGYGYLTSLDKQGGIRARQSIAQGAVITPNMVEANSVIQKGQKVYLTSGGSPIKVSMAGIALENAAIGARIKVKNLSSGRQLEGIVESDHNVVIP